VEKVFQYFTNPSKAPEWIKSMKSVSDVTGNKKGDHYKWTYSMAGMKFNGETEITELIPNKREVVHSKGGIESTWDYLFEQRGDDTELKLAIDYTVPVPVLGKIAEKLILKQNEREAEESLATAKKKIEV
jgi:uncharacterized membrane protein